MITLELEELDNFVMDEDLQRLLQENLKQSKEIHAIVLKTKKYLFWGQVLGWLKFVIVIVPVVIAIFYAIPILRNLIGAYQHVMQNLGATGLPTNATTDVIKNFLTK